MPQGKGTYGSKVGRPPKKKYQSGGNVDPFSTRNAAGVPAQQAMESLRDANMANPEGLPTSDARDRLQTSPDATSYKEGGFIKKAVGKYKREKARKNAVKEFPITGIVQPKKKGLKPAKVPSNPPLFKGDTTKEKIKDAARKAVDLGSLGLTIGIGKKKKRKKK